MIQLPPERRKISDSIAIGVESRHGSTWLQGRFLIFRGDTQFGGWLCRSRPKG